MIPLNYTQASPFPLCSPLCALSVKAFSFRSLNMASHWSKRQPAIVILSEAKDLNRSIVAMQTRSRLARSGAIA